MQYSRSPLYVRDEEYKRKVDEIVELYKSGWRTVDIAEKYKMHRTSIVNILKKRGVQFRSRKKFDYETICEIGYWWENTDISREEIADMFNITPRYMGQLMYKYSFRRKEQYKKGRFKEVPIVKIDKDNNLLAEYKSINDASRKSGYKSGALCRCVNGKSRNRTVGGYRWMKSSDYFKTLQTSV